MICNFSAGEKPPVRGFLIAQIWRGRQRRQYKSSHRPFFYGLKSYLFQVDRGVLEWVPQQVELECIPQDMSLNQYTLKALFVSVAVITLKPHPTYAVSFDFNFSIGQLPVIE